MTSTRGFCGSVVLILFLLISCSAGNWEWVYFLSPFSILTTVKVPFKKASLIAFV
jgi:hypothetical protein